MQAVADIIDRNNDGYIDHQEFMAALRPDWNLPLSEQEQIEDEVQRQVALCTCRHKFRVHHVGEGKYRVSSSTPKFHLIQRIQLRFSNTSVSSFFIVHQLYIKDSAIQVIICTLISVSV